MTKSMKKPMKNNELKMPSFKSESAEADWWASPAGRAYVKQKSVEVRSTGAKAGGSSLVAQLNEKRSIQIVSACLGPILRRLARSPTAKASGTRRC